MSHLITGHVVVTHNNTIDNVARGVGERVLYTNAKLDKPISPVEGIFVRRLESYRKTLIRGLGWQSPVSRQEFVGFYKGPRAALYQRAVNGLEIKPIRPQDSFLKTFVKAEKINTTLKSDPVPRVIQPRSPRYNVEVGRYLRPIEKLVYKEIDALFAGPTIMSEYNAFRQAEVLRSKWEMFSNPACVGLDASRFDQHVSQQALKFEHSIYNDVFKSRELKWLLNMQLRNCGFADASDGSFTYVKYGSRMSGDMNTSLGNKILMCLMAKAYIDSLPFRVEFVNNGDDCLMFMEKRDVSKLSGLKPFFVDFGFNIVTEEPVYEFEQVVFCQTQPIKSNNVWRMVRGLKTSISKDVTNVNLGHRVDEYRGWLRDVAKCGEIVAKDVPVLGRFYAMLERFSTDHKYSSGSDNEYRWYNRLGVGAKSVADKPDDYGRLSFYLAFGISPDEQLALERYFDQAIWGDSKRQLTTTLDYIFK